MKQIKGDLPWLGLTLRGHLFFFQNLGSLPCHCLFSIIFQLFFFFNLSKKKIGSSLALLIIVTPIQFLPFLSIPFSERSFAQPATLSSCVHYSGTTQWPVGGEIWPQVPPTLI